MIIYTAVIGLTAGICLGFSILYLFVGLRRKDDKPLNISFALFALGYAGTLTMGIGYRSTDNVADFIALGRWDTIFIILAYVALLWHIVFYANVRPRIFVWGLTAVFVIAGIVTMLTPTLTMAEMPTLVYVQLPWGEQIAHLDGIENSWGTLFLLGQLSLLAFILYAIIRQYRRGERQAAVLLGSGFAFFIVALAVEIAGEIGAIPYFPIAEIGFLGIAIAMSVQMMNAVIKTEEGLAVNQKNLERLVTERTGALEIAQAQLIEKAQETAVSEERSRIAHDLHDAVTQTIYSAALIAEVLPKVWARDSQQGEAQLFKLRQLVRGALAELRTMLFELRPSALETSNLDVLLPQLGDAFTGKTRIPVHARITDNIKLPNDVVVGFYRIAQEVFNNIGKHAEATQVNLTLHQLPEQTILIIRDNGIGFEQTAVSGEHMGLKIMEERAKQIDAHLNIDSGLKRGTQVSLLWPLEKEGEENKS